MGEKSGIEAFMRDVSLVQGRHHDVSSGFENNDGRAYLAFIAVRSQGRGVGTAFMTEVEALLDRHGVTMDLEPEGDVLDVWRLGNWYRRHGFRWIDDRRMRRDPG